MSFLLYIDLKKSVFFLLWIEIFIGYSCSIQKERRANETRNAWQPNPLNTRHERRKDLKGKLSSLSFQPLSILWLSLVLPVSFTKCAGMLVRSCFVFLYHVFHSFNLSLSLANLMAEKDDAILFLFYLILILNRKSPQKKVSPFFREEKHCTNFLEPYSANNSKADGSGSFRSTSVTARCEDRSIFSTNLIFPIVFFSPHRLSFYFWALSLCLSLTFNAIWNSETRPCLPTQRNLNSIDIARKVSAFEMRRDRARKKEENDKGKNQIEPPSSLGEIKKCVQGPVYLKIIMIIILQPFFSFQFQFYSIHIRANDDCIFIILLLVCLVIFFNSSSSFYTSDRISVVFLIPW